VLWRLLHGVCPGRGEIVGATWQYDNGWNLTFMDGRGVTEIRFQSAVPFPTDLFIVSGISDTYSNVKGATDYHMEANKSPRLSLDGYEWFAMPLSREAAERVFGPPDSTSEIRMIRG